MKLFALAFHNEQTYSSATFVNRANLLPKYKLGPRDEFCSTIKITFVFGYYVTIINKIVAFGVIITNKPLLRRRYILKESLVCSIGRGNHWSIMFEIELMEKAIDIQVYTNVYRRI